MKAGGESEIQALALIAVRPNNDVAVVTSYEMLDTLQPLARDWADSCQRDAHVRLASTAPTNNDGGDAPATLLYAIGEVETSLPPMSDVNALTGAVSSLAVPQI